MGTINKNIWWNISEIGTIDMDILMNYFRNGKLERSRRIFDKIFQKWERSQCRSCTNAIQPMKTRQIRSSRRVMTIFTYLPFFTGFSASSKWKWKRWMISFISGSIVDKNGHILPTGQWYTPSAVINDKWYCIVLHSIAWYCMVLHGIAWYWIVLHYLA